MAPNNTTKNEILLEKDIKAIELKLSENDVKVSEYKLEIVWKNVIRFILLHLAAAYGGKLFLTSAKWETDAFALLLYVISSLGVTAGAHRLWSHKSYKAKWPLRLILVIWDTLASQDPVIIWARDHRLHHKYSETDADPHNSSRGLFFAHIGWLLCRKHPEVKRKGKTIDLSDLYADPILRFQKKYYFILMPLMCFIIPTLIPLYYWNESCFNALFVVGFFRYTAVLNAAFTLNSIAHKWGYKPYDKDMNPTDHITANIITLGEGYHNYHHTFPWDYRTAELGCLNLTTHFIDFFSKIGWAYDLKITSEEIVRKRAKRTGDGSHALWGWGDNNQSKEEIKNAVIISKGDN